MKRYYFNIVYEDGNHTTTWGEWKNFAEVITSLKKSKRTWFKVDSILLIEDV